MYPSSTIYNDVNLLWIYCGHIMHTLGIENHVFFHIPVSNAHLVHISTIVSETTQPRPLIII